MKHLYEILIPCNWNDGRRISKRHHNDFDSYVRRLSGGLTILKPGKGQWVYKGELIEELVIPVRIYCTSADIERIMNFALTHYQQDAIMAYMLSSEVYLLEKV